MPTSTPINRRDFIKLGIGTGAGLLIGVHLGSCDNTSTSGPTVGDLPALSPNAWLDIRHDGSVLVTVAQADMGQGVRTALPMLVAEELEVDWAQIRVRQAPTIAAYGSQSTGGSASVREAWLPLRQAGATGRQWLINAAASLWGVLPTECVARAGAVTHSATQRTLAYPDLIDHAKTLPAPTDAPLKPASAFRLIGAAVPALDTPSKVDGSAVFGSDIQLPDMLVATIRHCPVFGGKIRRYDDSRCRAVRGFRHIVAMDDRIAAVGTHYWAAYQALQAVDIEWDEGPHAAVTSETLRQRCLQALDTPGETLRDEGDTLVVLAKTESVIEAVYEAPLQAHATMEPMTCVAHVRDGECDIWAPTQSPSSAKGLAGDIALTKVQRLIEKVKRRLGSEGAGKVRVHTTLLGGGFGRRLEQDFVEEAVRISKAIGTPVKLIWARDEDIQHDFYRPPTVHRLRASVDAQGRPLALEHRIAGPGGGLASGGASSMPYTIANVRISYHSAECSVPLGPWRSVGSSHNAYVLECFIDELAHRTGTDPLQYRLALLDDDPRMKAILELAAAKAGWGRALPAGHALGIALHKSFGSYAAQVAEVSVADDVVHVRKVVCAIDCGTAVHPDNIRAQMEGGIVFGLTAALHSHISVEKGRVLQTNFNDFPLLRMDQMPEIETHIMPSQEPPQGVGEPGVPPIAPAVANAVFAATGKRLRQLPLRPAS